MKILSLWRNNPQSRFFFPFFFAVKTCCCGAMGCGASSESALDEKARSDPGTGGRRGDSGFWKEASVVAGTEVVDIQPWESTVRSGEGAWLNKRRALVG